jgi:hypothetical protein
MKNTLIVSLLIMVPLFGTILSRSTFEEWEGSLNWTTNTGGNGDVRPAVEDPNNNYQTQSHGEWSIRLQDPNDNSYASAIKIISNGASGYMVEMHVWVRSAHECPIDSFPLCVLWNVALPETLYPELQFKTDIALVLDSVGVPPNGTPFYIHVQDANGWQNNVAHIHSTDQWFKIQIHRHEGVVDFYLDGELEGTFQPMNSNYVSNKIALGTTQADSLADGEVFYDDVIISTPPSGEHPRLLFTDNDLSTLRARKSSETYTYLGLKYKDIWAKLDSFADHFIYETDTIVWKKDGPTDTLCDTFEYPYEQFTFLPRNDTIEFWLGPQRRVASELLTLAFVALVDTTADSIRSHAEGLLAELSHWQMWNDPYFIGDYRQYIQLGVGHFMFSIALAYDWLYDSLSNYERLSVQNTLINLGINQTYLEALYGVWGPYTNNKWPNGTAVMIGGMGLGCLALDGCDLTSEFDTAEARIDALLSDSTVCDPAGGFAEGVSYAGYAVDHLATFCEANNSLNSYATGNKFLANYPDWRIWCMLPGAEQYYTKEYCEPTYWDVTFCDYDHRGGIWSTAIARIADETNDSEARWFLKRRKDLDFYGKDYSQNRKFSRWDIYLPFALFLWVDAGDTSKPNPDTLLKTFSNVGWIMARTGWQDDDYLLALKSGPWFERHNHHEQGSFIFGGKGRWLIADMGYATKKSYISAEYHNVLYEPNSESLYCYPHTVNAYYSPDSTYSYLQTIGETFASRISPWHRDILFLNQLGSFAVMDYAEEHDVVDTLYWQIHSWDEPDTSENGKVVRGSDPETRNYIWIPLPSALITVMNE